MITIKVTEEEYQKIMSLRKKKKISEKEIKEKISNWIESVAQVEKATFELYELYDTNDEAQQIIKVNVDYDLFYDLYKIFEEEDE